MRTMRCGSASAAGLSRVLALMHAAKALGKPVKGWLALRRRSSDDHHGRAVELTGELALARTVGSLAWGCAGCATWARISRRPGASSTPSTVDARDQAYRIPALFGPARARAHNTTSITAYRGAGRPGVRTWSSGWDEAARELGIDRVELRRRNLIPKQAFPYKTRSVHLRTAATRRGSSNWQFQNSKWGSFEFERRKQKGAESCAASDAPCSSSPRRGGLPQERRQSSRRFGQRGAHVLRASGQGHETMFPAIVAEVLGLPRKTYLKASDPRGRR